MIEFQYVSGLETAQDLDDMVDPEYLTGSLDAGKKLLGRNGNICLLRSPLKTIIALTALSSL